MSKKKKSRKPKRPLPIDIEVIANRSVGEIIRSVKGQLELISTIFENADHGPGEVDTDVVSPDLILSIPRVCRLAARDLDYVELYLGEDAASFHKNQVEELALQTPGGASRALPPSAPVPIAARDCARMATAPHWRRIHRVSIINRIDMFL